MEGRAAQGKEQGRGGGRPRKWSEEPLRKPGQDGSQPTLRQETSILSEDSEVSRKDGEVTPQGTPSSPEPLPLPSNPISVCPLYCPQLPLPKMKEFPLSG